MIKLKIVSDGTARGTLVCDAETGEEIYGVGRVTFECNMPDYFAVATIELVNVPVDLVARLEQADVLVREIDLETGEEKNAGNNKV